MGDTTTNRDYRKPLSTDDPENLTSFWRNLADDVDADVESLTGLYKQSKAGTVNVTITSPATSNTAAVTFSGTAFGAAPLVICQVVSSAGAAVKATCLVTVGPTTSGFTVRVDFTAAPGSPTTVAVHWIAMSAT